MAEPGGGCAALERILVPRRVLVTGGTGSIGASIALHFAEHGSQVVVVDLIAAEKSLREAVYTIIADVADHDECNEAVGAATEMLGGLDLIVNAAGVQCRRGLEVTPVEWERVLGVNLTGALWTVKAGLHALSASECGAVVNVSSSKAIVAVRGDLPYSTSKAALAHLTRLLAVELAPVGVRVNAVAPTLVPSAMTAALLEDRAYVERKLNGIPLRSFAQPDDIAGVVCFLGSSQSRMITGQTVLVDGGESLD